MGPEAKLRRQLRFPGNSCSAPQGRGTGERSQAPSLVGPLAVSSRTPQSPGGCPLVWRLRPFLGEYAPFSIYPAGPGPRAQGGKPRAAALSWGSGPSPGWTGSGDFSVVSGVGGNSDSRGQLPLPQRGPQRVWGSAGVCVHVASERSFRAGELSVSTSGCPHRRLLAGTCGRSQVVTS